MGFIPFQSTGRDIGCYGKTPFDHVLKAWGSEEGPADWMPCFNVAGS